MSKRKKQTTLTGFFSCQQESTVAQQPKLDKLDDGPPTTCSLAPQASTSSLEATCEVFDIADFINIRLSDEQRNYILQEAVVDSNFSYPARLINGKNRMFNVFWLKEFPWLVYSKREDGVYCKACVLFARPDRNSTLKRLYTEPLVDWQVALKRLRSHRDNSDVHKAAIAALDEYKAVSKGIQDNVLIQLNAAKKARVAANREKIKCMLDIVIFCGKQNIALRGHRDDTQHYDTPGNVGNFQALINFRISSGDQVLARHLEGAGKTATYRSKTTQNELIEVCGDYILGNIKEKVAKAKFFSVLADEATDVANKCLVPIVIRYVDAEAYVASEDFIGFVELTDRPTGRAIADAVVVKVMSFGLDMNNCRGQCYDGAGNMAGKVNGAAAIVMRDYPKAEFTHCRSHALNLAVMNGCKVQLVKNMINVVGDLTRFFEGHPVRTNILKSKLIDSDTRRAGLIELCTTRWVERIDSLDCVYDLFEYICDSLWDIANGGFSGDASARANGLLYQLKSSAFLVSFVLVRSLLHYSLGLTKKLQKSGLDWLGAYSEVTNVIETLVKLRASDDAFDAAFECALSLAGKISVDIVMPRVVSKQTLRDNPPASSASEYYRLSVYNPFLDHMIADLKLRFNESSKVNLWKSLLPGSVNSREISTLAEMYQTDLPSPRSLASEINLYCNKLSNVHGTDFFSVLKQLDVDIFPNLNCLLRLLATKPITTCECERSISSLRRLKTYLRSTMSNVRLNGLALMCVHYDMHLDRDAIMELFCLRHPRRLELV